MGQTDRKILIFGIFAVFCWIIFPFVQSLCLALLLCAVLASPVDTLQKRYPIRRTGASLIVTTAFSIGVLVPLIILFVFVGRELIEVSRSIEEFIRSDSFYNLEFFEMIHTKLVEFGIDPREKISLLLNSVARGTAAVLARSAASIPQFILELFIFVLALFYSLVNKERLREIFADLLPLSRTEFEEFSSATVGIFRGVISGTLISGIIQGTLIGLGYWIFGVPNVMLFASLTAFLALIPLLGTGPTGIGAVIYLMIQDKIGAALGMLIIFGLASFSDNLVKPLVLKGSMEMHPLLALLGALGGLAVFGFIGLFLGPLVMALAVISLKLLRAQKSRQSVPDTFGT